MKRFLKQFDLKSDLPIHVSTLLEENKDAIVESIIVGRHPVYLQELSKVILGHQTFFHCYLVFNTNKGKFFLEKNPRIHLTKDVPEMKEFVELTEVPRYTMKEYIEKTQKFMGDKFIYYDCSTSNCQHFINGLLQGNGLSELDFVKQDVVSFLKTYEFMNFGIKIFTRFKGYFDILIKGGIYTFLTYILIVVLYKILKEIKCLLHTMKGFSFNISVSFTSSINLSPKNG
jgi:hypothetical protein